MNPIFALAIIGSRDYPHQMQVEVLRQSDISGQFLCLSADGTQLVIDQSRLTFCWVKPPNVSIPNEPESTIQAS